MEIIDRLGTNAKKASRFLQKMKPDMKKEALLAAADSLENHTEQILQANELDLQAARENGMSQALQDRLLLTPSRIAGIAQGMREVAMLDDPVGAMESMVRRPNGLMIGKLRVPLGVAGVIYEARPNVTADVFALCFKSGNACILKGGRDAYHSNQAIADAINEALASHGLPEGTMQLMSDNSREASTALMQAREYLDVLIPRGGAGLIQSVVKNASVPVIETGVGNCHIYIDEGADIDMALDIVENAKTQRIGVCNAAESLLIHHSMVDSVLPALADRLAKHSVMMHAESSLLSYLPEAYRVAATEEDWGKEYLDYAISMKEVQSLDEAIEHINRYNTGHSEAIVTKDYARAKQFLEEVDAAAVYVNASTRFTDGNEFGLGAEIGISTQKLHARGPMGLEALTTTKFIILGDGQIRP